MSDVIVHVTVGDDQAESRFHATVDKFAKQRDDNQGGDGNTDAPVIMTKTIVRGSNLRKALIFQDRQTAAEFLHIWRRTQHNA